MNHKTLMLSLIVAVILLMGARTVTARPPLFPAVEAEHGEAALSPLGTGFTYQGELVLNGNPVSDLCDFQFGLWDAATGGAQVGATQTANSVSVADGRFTTQIDFGNGPFNGEARWLAVAVRCPAGSGSYSALDPRQALTAAPYAFALPGLWTQPKTTSPNLIGGYRENIIGANVVGGTIAGGGQSGAVNQVADAFGVVSGGSGNSAGGTLATVGGGEWNTAGADFSTIGGGQNNVVTDTYGTIGGGSDNSALGIYTSVSGGQFNSALNWNATVGGGYLNTADGLMATVGGGSSNSAIGDYANVAGGVANDARTFATTVGGGNDNDATASAATVGGGQYNHATNYYAVVGGGISNNANGLYSTIGGGNSIIVSGEGATVSGGSTITVTADYAAVGGGNGNIASGSAATIPGGWQNAAGGDYSFAAGCGAQANHAGSFVWADSLNCTPFASERAYQFRVRAYGGAQINDEVGNWIDLIWNQPIDTSTGAYLSWGGVWTNASDANLKENYAAVDNREVLDTLAEMPLYTWNYKAENTGTVHLGPTAQDFSAAFGLGDSDTAISTVDADGVSLAAIQGLYEITQEQAAQIEILQSQNDKLESRLSALEQASGKSSAPSVRPLYWLPVVGFLLAGWILDKRRHMAAPDPAS